MVLQIHGALSSATQRVVALLLEKGVPYELVELDFLSMKHKSPEWLEKHPWGLSPYIDDDGFILYESRAITHYIAEKYQDQGTKGLIPCDVQGRAKYQSAVSVEINHIDPVVSQLAMEKIYKPLYYSSVTDEASFAAAREKLAQKLDVYDKILSAQKYIAGDTLTVADLNHLPWFFILDTVGCSDLIEERPHVKRWADELTSRPSWKAILKMLDAL